MSVEWKYSEARGDIDVYDAIIACWIWNIELGSTSKEVTLCNGQ